MKSSVQTSLGALLADSVDYAGLFPPAGLALRPALENHLSYAGGTDAWMLGRFVLPTAKWLETMQFLNGLSDAAQSLRISALGTKSASATEFLENLHACLQPAARFGRSFRERLTVDQLEMPLLAESASVAAVMLWQAAGLIETILPEPIRCFWEIPFSDYLPEILRVVAAHNAQIPPADRLPDAPMARNFRCLPFGVKFRTGGTEADAFPTCEQLAGALLAVRDAGVAVKFTAGLHHSIRRFDADIGTRMHGFLNVFAAGILAREHRLDLEETTAILKDEQPESFRFDDDGFAWRDRRVPTGAVAAHREFVTSFGSCSFDEPRDDLRGLGLM